VASNFRSWAATACCRHCHRSLPAGTSTGDGAAIAEATLHHMLAGPGPHPLTLFITQ